MKAFIERLPLLQAAQSILRERHLLIAAAAGYGKSVLLQQLVGYLPNSVYLRLTIDDDDVAVLQQRVRDVQADTLLLDDVHLLSADSAATTWLKELVTSDAYRLVISGRFLPFDAALMLAQQQVTQWDEQTLRFSAEITTQLLTTDANNWHAALAGWPLGVGLLQQLPFAAQQSQLAQSQLFDYLGQAVFDQLAPALQQMLRITAIPQTFSIAEAALLLNITSEAAAAHLHSVQARNLFIYQDTDSRFRYHDLFRQFLVAQSAAALHDQVVTQCIDHYSATDPYAEATPRAIELALAFEQFEQAAELLLNIEWTFLHEAYRYRSFHRWVMTLDPAVRDAHPALYRMAGHCLVFLPDSVDESFLLFERSEALALEQNDMLIAAEARFEHAHQRYMLYGGSDELLEDFATIAADAPPMSMPEVRATRIRVALLSDMGRFQQAKREWLVAYDIAVTMGLKPVWLQIFRRQKALYVLTPLGEYAEAREIFLESVRSLADAPGDQVEALANYCDLLLPMGRWDEMAAVRAQIENLREQLPDLASYMTIWLHFYDAMMIAAQQGDAVGATAELDLMRRGDDHHGIQLLSEQVGRITIARIADKLDRLDAILDIVEATKDEGPFCAGWAHLEADIARGLANLRLGKQIVISAETLDLYRMRARGELLRLRALVALQRHQQQGRWRPFVHIVLKEILQPHYADLLLKRDPELGAYFWALLLAEQVEPTLAAASLVSIGNIAPLLPLLQHASGAVRQQAAAVLAQIGDEQAMEALGKAISAASTGSGKAKNEKPPKAALQSALATLEAQPPPPLHIQLMGSFHVQRGAAAISNFHRPIVIRLLQYFAIHRGRSIPRDQIFEALWPNTPPDKAWTTFRTVYSRLRNTLEPHMRSKGPNRYFTLDGDSYIFDPNGYVTVDVELFTTALRDALAASQPLAQATSQLLSNYAQLLPDSPYADWLLEPREQIVELYVNGGLRLGQELLAGGNSAESQQWAQRILREAPWLEAAWQLLMRAYSRQNLRSRALRTYQEAQDALQNELAVEPSPLTDWLYKRLQAGETI